MSSLLDIASHGADEDGAPPEGDGDEPSHEEAGKAAVKAFISAVHSKDVDGAWDALKAAIANCPANDEDDAGGAGSDEDPSKGHAALLLMPHAR